MADDQVIVVLSDDDEVQDEVAFGAPEGFEVVPVKDARNFLVALGGRTPDLIIAEMRSGNAGGFSLGSEISQAQGFKDVPIFMLLERAQDEWLAKQAGAAGMRVKPIEASELIAEALALIDRPAG